MNRHNKTLVTYQVKASENTIQDLANDICLEQTVEVTKNLIPNKWIEKNIVGQVKQVTQIDTDTYSVVIGYSDEITAYTLPQFLSVLYGNISLRYGITVTQIKFSKGFLSHFCGPRFGIDGLRKILNVWHRPLLACVLKPVGLSPCELANLCYQLALGGIDIIKDDHGLANHTFCSFEERTMECMSAIRQAESKTNRKVLYFPNITDRYELMSKHINHVQEIGVGGILLSPMITGIDFMRYLSQDSDINLPIIAHPALSGSFFHHPYSGISPDVLLGTIMRIAGADLVIYPNFGGRFPFTQEICQKINQALKQKMDFLKPSLPMPGGGIIDIPALRRFYGNDVVFLIGSNLYNYSNNLTASVQYFRSLVEP